MAETKITKKQILEAVRSLIETGSLSNGVTEADVIGYIDLTISQMENKAEKARERAAKARAKGDELTEAIKAILTNTDQSYLSIDSILSQIEENIDATRAKVISRLTSLAKVGEVHKAKAKDEANHVISGDAVGPAPAEAAEAEETEE